MVCDLLLASVALRFFSLFFIFFEDSTCFILCVFAYHVCAVSEKARASDPLELELEIVVNCHVGAICWELNPGRLPEKQEEYLADEQFLQVFGFFFFKKNNYCMFCMFWWAPFLLMSLENLSFPMFECWNLPLNFVVFFPVIKISVFLLVHFFCVCY